MLRCICFFFIFHHAVMLHPFFFHSITAIHFTFLHHIAAAFLVILALASHSSALFTPVSHSVMPHWPFHTEFSFHHHAIVMPNPVHADMKQGEYDHQA